MMRIESKTYEYNGKYLSYRARPAIFYGVAATCLLVLAQIVFEVVVGRYLKWARPLAKKTRGMVMGGVGAALFAGCGFEFLRIFEWVYIDGQWYNKDEYLTCVEPSGPGVLRRARRLIILKNGRKIETDLDRDTITWAFQNFQETADALQTT
jgi:hypothetical protein